MLPYGWTIKHAEPSTPEATCRRVLVVARRQQACHERPRMIVQRAILVADVQMVQVNRERNRTKEKIARQERPATIARGNRATARPSVRGFIARRNGILAALPFLDHDASSSHSNSRMWAIICRLISSASACFRCTFATTARSIFETMMCASTGCCCPNRQQRRIAW